MKLAQIALWGALVTATAMAQEVKIGQVGVFAVHKISAGGKFSRCALTLEPGPSMLRISWNKDHEYSISVPPPPKSPGRLMMQISMGKAGSYSFDAKTDGKRAWATIDAGSIDPFMDLKKQIVIDVGGAHYVWQIGATKLEDAFVKLEDCVHKATGWH